MAPDKCISIEKSCVQGDFSFFFCPVENFSVVSCFYCLASGAKPTTAAPLPNPQQHPRCSSSPGQAEGPEELLSQPASAFQAATELEPSCWLRIRPPKLVETDQRWIHLMDGACSSCSTALSAVGLTNTRSLPTWLGQCLLGGKRTNPRHVVFPCFSIP